MFIYDLPKNLDQIVNGSPYIIYIAVTVQILSLLFFVRFDRFVGFVLFHKLC